MGNYVITVARGFGSGGKAIAEKLAKELGIPCYERQLLTLAAKMSGIDEKLFVETDEKLRGVHLTKRLKKATDDIKMEPHEKSFISNNNLFNIQAKIIKELAKTQSCIIVGKCADYVLRDYDNVIGVYIEAPRAACVKAVVEKLYVSKERASSIIRRTDRYRASYYRYYTGGGDWTNPTNYDLTINSEKVGHKNTVEVIKEYARIKFGVS